MTQPCHAVFISYASQDAAAAQRICDVLRAGGIEVWLDQTELRGGDVWDQKIRREIHDCALFIPVISANTASRHEGYFRLEWDLADQRTHMMARNRVFIVPVCLDATSEAGTDVPESFQRAQWTRLPAGETPLAFVERVRRLLSPELSTTNPAPAGASPGAVPPIKEPARAWWLKPAPLVIVAAVVLAAVSYVVAARLSASRQGAPSQPVASAQQATSSTSTAPAAFTPPPHSVAVLPFVNMSGDQEQEYFSDGLTEELLNSLAQIDGLQVAARTSAFSFKGKDTDIGTVGRKLNVAAVLEGSVRRSSHRVRVTAQLVDAVTGFHLWSRTYDRDLGDVLKLQTEIAAAVADALRVTLLGDVGAKIELGGTRNPAAFDAYLRGSKLLYTGMGDEKGLKTAIETFTEAIRLDPNYALAFAGRSLSRGGYVGIGALDPAQFRESLDNTLRDARQAIALTPQLAEGYRALGASESVANHYTQASEALERALALAPGNAGVLLEYSQFAAEMGRADAAIATGRRAVVLDPLNPNSHFRLGEALRLARRYEEAVAVYDGGLALASDWPKIHALRGLAYYGLGNLQSARASCETQLDNWTIQWCLAVVYDKLGRHADAEAVLAAMKATMGDSSAYQYATIYAQWGNTVKALEWLETALQLRDTGLIYLKTDSLMDPLRKEPRFQAIERELKFPS